MPGGTILSILSESGVNPNTCGRANSIWIRCDQLTCGRGYFRIRKKKLRIKKYRDTCGRGRRNVVSFTCWTWNTFLVYFICPKRTRATGVDVVAMVSALESWWRHDNLNITWQSKFIIDNFPGRFTNMKRKKKKTEDWRKRDNLNYCYMLQDGKLYESLSL